MSITSWWWRFVEDYIYHISEPPPRQRTVPLEVICVGLPRSGTESLQAALLQLGYHHTYHGWEIMFEKPNRWRAWARLAQRKWLGDGHGNASELTRQDFDSLMGHCMAVTDIPACAFAAEMIDLYPDAKVVLNYRSDLDAWQRSMEETVIAGHTAWLPWLLTRLDAELFWLYNTMRTYMLPGILRYTDSRESPMDALRARGKWVYREHCDMIRGKVPPGRLLEWAVEDGWEPLCKFLDKDIPDEPFPHVNAKSKGWKDREARWTREMTMPLLKRIGLKLAVLSLVIGVVTKIYLGKSA